MEKQHSQFDSERESLRQKLLEEEVQTNNLRMEVSRLSQQLETVQQQLRSRGMSPSSIQIRSSASPARTVNTSPMTKTSASVEPSGGNLSSTSAHLSQGQPVSSTSFNNLYNPQPHPAGNFRGPSTSQSPSPGQHLGPASMGMMRPGLRSSTKVVDGGRIGSSSPEREVIYRPDGSAGQRIAINNARIGPQGRGERMNMDYSSSGSGPAKVVNVPPGSSATVTTHGGSKIAFQVAAGTGGGGVSVSMGHHPQRRLGQGSPAPPIGRGVPPPIPPNKPNFVAQGPSGRKPSPPPKSSFVSHAQGKEMGGGSGNQGSPYMSPNPHGVQSSGQRGAVQIPVNYIGSGGTSPASSGGHLSTQPHGQPVQKNVVANVRTQVRETSPSAVRKNSQVCVNAK